MIRSFKSACLAATGLVLLTLLPAASSCAEGSHVEIGARASAMHISQSVADEMVGVGLLWRYHVRDDWFVVFSLDSYKYEIDDPLGLIGNPQSGVGLPVRNAVFTTALGKNQQLGETRFDWFWHAGIGVGFASVSSKSGVDNSGEPYDLHTDAGTEIHMSAALGAAYHLSSRWTLVGASRVEHHFVDLQIDERESDTLYTVESLTPIGVFLSMNYRF